jgi:hypothetical protein
LESVTILGDSVVDAVLDAKTTPLNATATYQWKSCDTENGDYVHIPGATSNTYSIVFENTGKYLKVTAIGSGLYTGNVTSGATAMIIPAQAAPTATNVQVSGTAQVGETLTGSYQYNDINDDLEGVSAFRWLADTGALGEYEAITDAVSLTYVVDASLFGHTIKFEVTPMAATGIFPGESVASIATDVVSNAETTIATAAISGITVPVKEETPVATIAETAEYIAEITWSPDDALFESDTVYTATITLTPKTGYTLSGVAEDFFTVAGAVATNGAGAGIVSAVFPKTAGAYAIGDIGPGSGYVFFDKGISDTYMYVWNGTTNVYEKDITLVQSSTAWRYLEAAPRSAIPKSTLWGDIVQEVGASARGTAMGTGLGNTNAIVAKLGDYIPSIEKSDYAAKDCYNLVYGDKSDWYLPSKDELNEISNQRASIGDFYETGYFWTSTETSIAKAWEQVSYHQNFVSKESTAYVRAVRAF